MTFRCGLQEKLCYDFLMVDYQDGYFFVGINCLDNLIIKKKPRASISKQVNMIIFNFMLTI